MTGLFARWGSCGFCGFSVYRFGLRVSEGRRRELERSRGWSRQRIIATYRSFAKVFFWLLVRHLSWCGRRQGRDGAFGSHKLYNSKCELAYETLSTYGLVFSPSLSTGVISFSLLITVTHESVREWCRACGDICSSPPIRRCEQSFISFVKNIVQIHFTASAVVRVKSIPGLTNYSRFIFKTSFKSHSPSK